MAIEFGQFVEAPHSDAGKVHAVGLDRLQVDVAHQLTDVVPVLHGVNVDLILNQDFDRRQKVVVTLGEREKRLLSQRTIEK